MNSISTERISPLSLFSEDFVFPKSPLSFCDVDTVGIVLEICWMEPVHQEGLICDFFGMEREFIKHSEAVLLL